MITKAVTINNSVNIIMVMMMTTTTMMMMITITTIITCFCSLQLLISLLLSLSSLLFLLLHLRTSLPSSKFLFACAPHIVWVGKNVCTTCAVRWIKICFKLTVLAMCVVSLWTERMNLKYVHKTSTQAHDCTSRQYCRHTVSLHTQVHLLELKRDAV